MSCPPPEAASAPSADSPSPPPGLVRARALQAAALQCVATLDTRTASMLAARETDFLRSFRANLHALQAELVAVRARSDEAVAAATSGDRVRALEKERDTFRAEALRLDTLLASGVETLCHAKEAAAALREDNAWLTRQLRDARRTMAVTKAVEESGTGVAAKKPGQG